MLRSLTILACIAMLFASCGTIREDFTFKKNGSGEWSNEYDLSGIMAFVQSMSDGDDPLSAGDGMGLSQDMDDMDSTFVFYDVAPDSVKQSMKNPDLLKKMYMNARINAADEEMKVRMSMEFDSYDELEQLMTEFASLSVLEAEQAAMLQNNPIGISADFSKSHIKQKRSFERKPRPFDMDSLMDGMGDGISIGDSSEMEGMMKMFFAGSDYVVTVRTPKKIKDVTCECKHEMVDKKTVELKFDMGDMMEKGMIPGFAVRY